MHKPLSRNHAIRADEVVIGVDEAGRGPLAGPVVAGAVVLCRPRPGGLDDSKKLTRERRAVLEAAIKRRCRWSVGVAAVEEIEALNIFGATMLAMTRAVAALCDGMAEEVAEVLVDGNLTPAGRRSEWRWPARAIVGGDASEPCISAASIIAKEHRDRLMRGYAREHPHYGWETNVGYGTPEHLAALQRHGPCPLHRRGFAPVAQLAMPLEPCREDFPAGRVLRATPQHLESPAGLEAQHRVPDSFRSPA